MWIEQRRQQYRVYWRKETAGKDYEAFQGRVSAEKFRALCRRYGREQVLAAHRAQQQTPTRSARRPPNRHGRCYRRDLQRYVYRYFG